MPNSRTASTATIIIMLILGLIIGFLICWCSGGGPSDPFWCEPLGCWVRSPDDCPGGIDGFDFEGSPIYASVRGNAVRKHMEILPGQNPVITIRFFYGDSAITIGKTNYIKVVWNHPGNVHWEYLDQANGPRGQLRPQNAGADSFRVELWGHKKKGNTLGRTERTWRSPWVALTVLEAASDTPDR